MKVLVSAYACEPDKGSEPGVGWNWVQQISRFSETWVVTRANNRRAIETALQQRPVKNLQFVYYDLPKWASWWKKGRRGIHLYYYLWQLGSARVVRRLNTVERFDLIHHLTLSAYWMPSGLSLVNAPMILGPIGGAERLPEPLAVGLSLQGRLYEHVKGLTHLIARLDPLVGKTLRKPRLVLAQTNTTVDRLNQRVRRSYRVYSAVGIDCAAVTTEADRSRRDQPHAFRIISVGRLLAFKANHLGLLAFSQLLRECPGAEYLVIGDGPEAARLKGLCATLNLEGSVRFLGALPRAEVLKNMASADVLLHPSMRDPPATVIAEAMAAGLPVVCLNHGGPGVQVTDSSGIAVAVGNEAQVIERFAGALSSLSRDRALLNRLKAGAREHALSMFDWQSKAAAIEKIYKEVVAQ